jgi:dihydropteroate synthase
VNPPQPMLGGRLSFDEPHVMGILNVTPDSFSDRGRFVTVDAAVAAAREMAASGAGIIDIGGESTRPGSSPVDTREQLARVLPVLDRLAGEAWPAKRPLLSIDTRNAEVMEAALDRGVSIVHDVSALLHDSRAAQVVAARDCAVVLMHHKGTPETMTRAAPYDEPARRVLEWLEARIEAAEAAGIARERIIVDPGIGFGEGAAHDLALLGGIRLLHRLGRPVLVGASRKRFIGRLARDICGGVDAPTDRRLGGSISAALAALAGGAHIIRVHDIFETAQAVAVWRAIGRSS